MTRHVFDSAGVHVASARGETLAALTPLIFMMPLGMTTNQSRLASDESESADRGRSLTPALVATWMAGSSFKPSAITRKMTAVMRTAAMNANMRVVFIKLP
jgi:hypothetical protein